MFGIDFTTSTFILIIFETLLLSFQLINYLSRVQDKSRFRFLILIIAFLQYNILSNIMPSRDLDIPYMLQNIIDYCSAFFLASYYLYYLIKELELTQLGIYSVKVLIISLCGSFVVLFFSTYFITGDFELSRKVFIIIPILISFYFCYQTVDFLIKKWKALKNKKTPYASVIVAGNIGIIFIATMPITDYFGVKNLNLLFVNVSLIVTFYAYMKNYFYQSKLEYDFLVKIGFDEQINKSEKEDIKTKFKQYNLTSKELDVALLILQGKSYKEIADHMFLVPKTISKHASNIFKKTNCSKKTEFIEVFSLEKPGN